MLTNPFAAVYETGLITLVSAANQVDQNDYGASVEVNLVTACGARSAAPISGEILHITLISTESGTGAVRTPAGVLYIMDADSGAAAGDTAILATARATIIAQIEVETTDWKADANGASATIFTKPVAFHALSSLWVIWFHEDATSFNSDAAHDELLRMNAWFRRDT